MLRYIGQGAFLQGIPARNLTDEEVAKYGKKRLLQSGLYVQVRATRPQEKKEPDEQASPEDGVKE